jgi:riboflavin kinase/FMN adenylyltransferase
MGFPAHLQGLAHAALRSRPLHLAIGMFDGVHLGHRRVIGAAVEGARREGGISGVLTFWPHPSVLFRPAEPTRLIQPADCRARLLASTGVDVVITEPFTRELAAVPADGFVPWLKDKLPNLAGIYVGENFRFGRGRAGDTALLQTTGRAAAIQVFSAPRLQQGGEPVSSTRIRTLLETGEVAAANSLLGYAYFSAGTVTPGKRLGRALGFPTLNVPWSPELRPRLGVYAVQVSGCKTQRALRGVANYGLRPTVEQASAPRLEIHLLEECPFDAGDEIRVEWLAFLRAEQKFTDIEALRAQIGRDRATAAEFFAR